LTSQRALLVELNIPPRSTPRIVLSARRVLCPELVVPHGAYPLWGRWWGTGTLPHARHLCCEHGPASPPGVPRASRPAGPGVTAVLETGNRVKSGIPPGQRVRFSNPAAQGKQDAISGFRDTRGHSPRAAGPLTYQGDSRSGSALATSNDSDPAARLLLTGAAIYPTS